MSAYTEFPSDLKRILLLGSTASGKISGGNALVRRKVFKAGTTMPKKTNYITEVDGMWLQVKLFNLQPHHDTCLDAFFTLVKLYA